MPELDVITNWIIGITLSGCVVRIIFLLVKMGADANEMEAYIKRIKHAIFWAIIALCSLSIKALILYYFG
jgi:hypothetical protein